jgi:hypothetical protein
MQDKFEVQPLGSILGLELKNGEKHLCEIDDLIIDPSDGSVDFVIVKEGGTLGLGEERRLIPMQVLKIQPHATDKEKLQATTTLTEEQVKNAPTCKKNQRISADLERRSRQAAGVPEEGLQPRSAQAILVCTKKVKGAPLNGVTEEKLGKLDEIFIDAHNMNVAYVVLASGGTLGLGEKTYALPWRVLDVSTDKDDAVELRSNLTKERLDRAPEYDPKNKSRMSNPDYLREVHDYYSIEPYWQRTQPASAGTKAIEEKRKEGH